MQPQAILIAVGDELVSGAVAETNSRFACQVLNALGVSVKAIQVVGDDVESLARVLTKASGDAEIVIMSGGLGPTAADRTRESLARALGVELEFRPELLAEIVFYFTSRGKVMPPANRQQAYIPAGAAALPNPLGTAPGILVDRGSRLLASLPGVPFEFCNMIEAQVLEAIHRKFAGTLTPYGSRNLLVTGVSESALDERVRPFILGSQNPRVGITAKDGAITLRLVARGKDQAEIDAALDGTELALRAVLGPDAAPGYPGTPEDALAAFPACRKVAVADAITGGHLASRLVDVGIEVAGWTGTPDFLAGQIPSLGVRSGAVEAAAGAAEAARLEAGLALWPGEEGFLFASGCLGDKAYEVLVVPTESPEINRRRLEAAALDLMRRLVQGLPPPDDQEELRALAALAEPEPGAGGTVPPKAGPAVG